MAQDRVWIARGMSDQATFNTSHMSDHHVPRPRHHVLNTSCNNHTVSHLLFHCMDFTIYYYMVVMQHRVILFATTHASTVPAGVDPGLTKRGAHKVRLVVCALGFTRKNVHCPKNRGGVRQVRPTPLDPRLASAQGEPVQAESCI